MSSNKNIYTPIEFAKRIGVHQTTVSRWIDHPFSKRKFKMYDAEVVEVAGKRFIKINTK